VLSILVNLELKYMNGLCVCNTKIVDVLREMSLHKFFWTMHMKCWGKDERNSVRGLHPQRNFKCGLLFLIIPVFIVVVTRRLNCTGCLFYLRLEPYDVCNRV
jgi:hypothetical protein